MATEGMTSGIRSGVLQGVKTGLGMSRSRSGLVSGLSNGIANKDKTQDPVTLASARNSCPYFYWNSENVTLSGSNVTAIDNLLNQYNPLTQSAESAFTVQSDPARILNGVFNNKSSIQFDTNDAFGLLNTAGPDMTNTSEMTIMMVCKLVSVGDSVFFTKADSNVLATVGDFKIYSDGTAYFVELVGNPTSQIATYQTMPLVGVNPPLFNKWILLTVKARLSLPNGPGSCLDIFVNGTREKYLVSDTITSLPREPTSTWSNSYIIFGNDISYVSGGSNQIASGLIIEEWINESEQLRLENFFREYYGYKF